MSLVQDSNGFWTDTPATQPGGQRLNDNFNLLSARNPKNNLEAIVDPTVDDDSSQGYAAGSRWHNTATGQVWYCFDETPTSALWQTSNSLNGNIVKVENGSGQLDFLLATGINVQPLQNPSGASFLTLNNSLFGSATYFLKFFNGSDVVFNIDTSGNTQIGGTVTVNGGLVATTGNFSSTIIGGTPTASNHLTTKAYVDIFIQGLKIKPTAAVATTAALPANSYLSGILTATTNGALTVDSHAVLLNELVLVKNEATAANNGLYFQSQLGDSTHPYKLTRDSSMDISTEIAGAFVPVSNLGPINANSLWLANPSGTIILGTTAIPFTQLNGATDLIAGQGIVISGNTISSSRTRLLSMSGITGTGTSADPFVGFDSYINGMTDEKCWELDPGYWDSAGQLTITANRCTLRGSGRGTIIRSHHSTAGGSVLKIHGAAGAERISITISDLTLDGNGLTKIGLNYINTNWSHFSNLTFRNAVDWCIQGTRAIGNLYDSFFARSFDMTTVTTNGMWLSAPDSENTDNATTTCTFNCMEFSTLPGYGLRMTDFCFGNVFNGGAFEVCGISLYMGTQCEQNVFNGTDFEESTGTGITIEGTNNIFNGCNAIGTDVHVTGNENRFIGMVSNYPNSTSATGMNLFINGSYSASNWGPGTTGSQAIFETDGGLTTLRKASIVKLLESTTGQAVGHSLLCSGIRYGHWISNDVATFLIDTFSNLDLTDDTVVNANYSLQLVGRNVTFGGNATVIGNFSVSSNGTKVAGVKSLNAGEVALEVFSNGATLGYFAASSNGHCYISGGGSLTYTTTAFAAEYALDINGRNITFGGSIGFYGHTPAAKPTVVGSKGGNAALGSLLSALAGLGLLTDSST